MLAEILYFGFLRGFFEESVKKKLMMANFLTAMCVESIDRSVTEQEVVYVALVDPENRKANSCIL